MSSMGSGQPDAAGTLALIQAQAQHAIQMAERLGITPSKSAIGSAPTQHVAAHVFNSENGYKGGIPMSADKTSPKEGSGVRALGSYRHIGATLEKLAFVRGGGGTAGGGVSY